MTNFKAWYEKKYGVYPGATGERISTINQRLSDAFAEYVDDQLEKHRQEISEIKSFLVI